MILSMRQSESRARVLPYPAAEHVEHAEPAADSGYGSPAVEVVSSSDPAFAAAKVVSSTESSFGPAANQAASSTEPAFGPAANQAASSTEPAFGPAANQAGSSTESSFGPAASNLAASAGIADVQAVSSEEPASGPAASAAAASAGIAGGQAVSSEEPASGHAAAAAVHPAEPAWEIRRVPGTGRSGPPVLELRPAGRDYTQTSSRDRAAYVSGHSGNRPTYYYNSNQSASRRYRRRRQQMRDLAIGMACLAGAVFLAGLLISQMLFAPAPAPVSETTAQDAPAEDSNTLPQGTGTTGSNYARVLVYLDSMQRVIEERYVAQDGTVVMNEKGYAIMRNQYDTNGNLTRTSYYDDNNNPVFVRELGYSSVSITYDQLGNKVGENYYDTDGSLLTGP